ncbi:NAD(P)-binding protein [Crocinitomicaceae bacterium]|nr:NAD(P)-binding protein [Crocinitomicaceae bacterium]
MGSKKYIISGSGVSGLTAALLLCEQGKGEQTIIIETGTTIGGLLKKYNYGEFGDFDCGMHNFLETGISELDKLMFNLLPESEWQLLEEGKRDLAGIFFNNKLQKNTPYFDLRSLNKSAYQESIASLFQHISNTIGDGPINKDCNAKEFAYKLFGETVAEHTIIPAIEKIHRKSANELDYMSTVFTPMNRVAFTDEPLIRELTESKILRNILAWSDQRTLPFERSSGRRAYYPKKYGAYRVLEAIEKRLIEFGVTILTNSGITEIKTDAGSITSVSVKNVSGDLVFDNLEKLIWTANIPLLGRFLGTDFTGLKNDKPLKTVIINILLDQPLDMGDLYYFFCYQPGFYTYRLTNYVNYSSGAIRNGNYPICIEFLITKEELEMDLEERAIEELNKFGILKEGTNVVFKKAEILERGFPMPSRTNINSVKKIRQDIRSKKLNNLETIGILAEDNLFFQTDVLIDLYNKISK